MVVCYKLSSITWFLAKKMASVKHLSLVNLIVGKEVVRELLQNNMKPKNIVKEINYLLSEEGKARWKQNHAFLLAQLIPQEKNHTKMQQNTFYNKLIFKTKVLFLWITIKLLYGLNRFTVEGMENITNYLKKIVLL